MPSSTGTTDFGPSRIRLWLASRWSRTVAAVVLGLMLTIPLRSLWSMFTQWKADRRVSSAYAFAVSHRDLLSTISCHCGFCEYAGHKSSVDCFVDGVDAQGRVRLSRHAERCKMCVDIALTAQALVRDGKSFTEIRQLIDWQYGDGTKVDGH